MKKILVTGILIMSSFIVIAQDNSKIEIILPNGKILKTITITISYQYTNNINYYEWGESIKKHKIIEEQYESILKQKDSIVATYYQNLKNKPQ